MYKLDLLDVQARPVGAQARGYVSHSITRQISDLSMLQFPVSHEAFTAQYFEQEPLLCPGALSEINLGWRDFDELLTTLEPDPATLQLFLDGPLDPSQYLLQVVETGRPKMRIDKHRFYELMQNGATLVLNRAEEYCLPARRLCAAVGSFARLPTSGNAYVSFAGLSSPGASTFGKHWDTHDVFAIQLIGRKRWQIYPPTHPLPLSHQTNRRLQQKCPAVPAFDYELAAGDLLYIPRGWWHQVTPLESASFHLSVGTYPQTLSDYILWVCGRHLPQLLDARRACSDNPAAAANLDTLMQSLNQAIFSPPQLRDFVQHQHALTRANGEFHTEFFLADPTSSLADDARLALAGAFLPADTAEIQVHGGRLKLSPVSQGLLRLLAVRGSLAWGSVQMQMPQVPPAALREAVRDLLRYEVITLLE